MPKLPSELKRRLTPSQKKKVANKELPSSFEKHIKKENPHLYESYKKGELTHIQLMKTFIQNPSYQFSKLVGLVKERPNISVREVMTFLQLTDRKKFQKVKDRFIKKYGPNFRFKDLPQKEIAEIITLEQLYNKRKKPQSKFDKNTLLNNEIKNLLKDIKKRKVISERRIRKNPHQKISEINTKNQSLKELQRRFPNITVWDVHRLLEMNKK